MDLIPIIELCKLCLLYILKSLACSLLPDTLSITVRRDHLFQDAMQEGQKTKFNVNKNIKVSLKL